MPDQEVLTDPKHVGLYAAVPERESVEQRATIAVVIMGVREEQRGRAAGVDRKRCSYGEQRGDKGDQWNNRLTDRA